MIHRLLLATLDEFIYFLTGCTAIKLRYHLNEIALTSQSQCSLQLRLRGSHNALWSLRG